MEITFTYGDIDCMFRRECGEMKQNPRYNVISMRISDEEKEMLQNLILATRKSLSDLMREALATLKPRKFPLFDEMQH
jgi:Ribbon-helix-helix protein, copG family